MKNYLSKTTLYSLLLSQVIFSVYATDSTDENAQLVSVESVKIEQVNPTLWLPGNVISLKNAPISAEQTGQLLWIEDVGSQVIKGQSIATIDNRHLKLQLAQQKSQVKQHQADVDYLTSQKNRMSALSQKNNTAVSELERITKDLAVAESEVIGFYMLVKQTELAIEKTNIVAPFNGNISERFVDVGEFISIGRPLVQLVDTNNLDIKIAAPISIASFLRADMNVMVKWQDKLVELPIRTWSKAGNQLSRTFDVRLVADGLNLLAGSAVTVSLPKQSPSEATMVPRDALILRENETFVLTIDDKNQAKKINVLTGEGVGSWIAVTGLLLAGDNVITRGGERLQNGQKVRVDDSLVTKAIVKL